MPSKTPCLHHQAHTTQKKAKPVAIQELWKNFFADPSRWWDNRFNKGNPKLPDFVHKATKQALWFDCWHDPPWVEVQLSALDENHTNSSSATRAAYLPTSREKPQVKTITFGNVKKLCEGGQLSEALHAVNLLDQGGYRISTTIFYRLLQECINKGNLAAGRALHRLIIKGGFESDVFLGNHLIRLFTLFGSLREAQQVFSKLTKPDVFVWSAIISAHGKLGQGEQGIDLYYQMQQSNVKPDGHVFVAALKACISAACLTHGKMIHGHILETVLESDVVVANALIDMYTKCGSLQDGQRIFDKLPSRDVVSWCALIAGYALHGHDDVAIKLYYRMPYEGIEPNIVTCNAVIACYAQHGQFHAAVQLFHQMRPEPDNFTFVSLLKACITLKLVEKVHAHIVEMGLQNDVIIGNTLIDMYAEFGSLPDAYKVFDNLSNRNMVTWNALIAGYAQNGNVYEADLLLQRMQQEGIKLDNVAWNVLIAGYAVNGLSHKAFSLYQQMEQLGMKPDNVTFLSILKACSVLSGPESISLIHSQIFEWGLHLDIMVANTLIDIYAKSGSIKDARRVFDMLSNRSVVTWNAMIAGYTQHSFGQEAFELFSKMQYTDIEPDKFTYVSILKASSSILALDQGKLVHDQVVRGGFQGDIFVWSCLVDMYVKCGSGEDAQRLFLQTCDRDTVMWNAMIAGYAQNNDYNLALHCFRGMQQGDCRLDDVTYVGLLSACGHAGLVEEGCSHFKTMTEYHCIAPTLDHYNCLVDILGRAGFLHEAISLLESVPFQRNLPGWTSLLGHCRAHGNVELGEKCYDYLVSCDRSYASGYVLMSSIYDMWKHAEKVSELR